MKEIILERVRSADLQYVTLDYYRDNEFVRLSSLMEDYDSRTWCAHCRENLELACRQYLAELLSDDGTTDLTMEPGAKRARH